MNASDPSKSKKEDCEVPEYEDATHDAVFGEITEEGPNYRNVCTGNESTLISYGPRCSDTQF